MDAARLMGPALDELSGAELSEFVLDMFQAADMDRNGVLDRREFKSCLGATYLNLSKQEMTTIMVEADENADGTLCGGGFRQPELNVVEGVGGATRVSHGTTLSPLIPCFAAGILDYAEFTPLMTSLIRMTGARRNAQQAGVERAAQAKAHAGQLVKGMRRAELEGLMRGLFQQCDLDGNGTLDRKELKACLLRPELGLSRKELNHLLSELKVDDANAVHYDTFVPLCFDILHQRLTEDLVAMSQDGNAVYQVKPPSMVTRDMRVGFPAETPRWWGCSTAAAQALRRAGPRPVG